MAKCDCYFQHGLKFLCYGTKEMEECSCGGDKSKCDFYPENRKQKIANEKRLIPCGMCDNAFVNPELSKDEDLSYVTVGHFIRGKRMMLRTGSGKTTQIIVEEYDKESKMWQYLGFYRPNFCPNCGRELVENRKEIENGR